MADLTRILSFAQGVFRFMIGNLIACTDRLGMHVGTKELLLSSCFRRLRIHAQRYGDLRNA